MSVSQTGGSDLCVRHIRRKNVWGAKHRRYLGGMVVAHLGPADKILGATVRIVGLTNGGATIVLFFCVGICSDDGDGDGWGAMQKNRLNIGKMQLEQPGFYFFCFYVMSVAQTGGYDLCVRHIRQKNGCGRSIGVIWGASVAGGQDFGGDGAYSWFDQWWCNQCFIFLCWYLC